MIQESFTPDGHSGDESTAVRGVCLQGIALILRKRFEEAQVELEQALLLYHTHASYPGGGTKPPKACARSAAKVIGVRSSR
jgi:hypothetical protein